MAELTTDGDVIEFDNMFPTPADSPDSVQIVYKIGIHGEFKDYCNNWNDIMPIAVELKVGLMINWHVADIWSGIAHSSNKFDFSSESPQRALVICCIKVLESESK